MNHIKYQEKPFKEEWCYSGNACEESEYDYYDKWLEDVTFETRGLQVKYNGKQYTVVNRDGDVILDSDDKDKVVELLAKIVIAPHIEYLENLMTRGLHKYFVTASELAETQNFPYVFEQEQSDFEKLFNLLRGED